TAGRVAVRNGAALAVGSGVTDANVAAMLATGNFASGGAIGFDVATADRTYSSALTGTMGLAVLDTDTAATNVLVLSGDNNFSGGTTVYSGTLRLSNQNALRGSVLNLRAGSVVFDSSVAGNAFAFGGLAGSANLALQNNAGTPAAVALTVGSANTDTVHTGVISGAGSLTKTGTGKLTLTGANTFSGGLVVNGGAVLLATTGTSWNTSVFGALATVNNGGRLQIGAGNNTGSAATITVNAGGVLEYVVPYSLSGGNATYMGTYNLAGSAGSAADVTGVGAPRLGFNANSLINSTGAVTNTWSAGMVLYNGSSRTLTLTTGDGNTLLVSGSINDSTEGGTAYAGTPVIKNGNGTLVLAAANTHTGQTTLSAGTLRLAHGLALRSSTLSVGGSVAFDSSVAPAAFTFGGLSGSGNLALQNNAGTPAAVALTVGGNNAATTYSGILSGAGSLTKVGTGTLTLSSASTYSGGTTFSGRSTISVGNDAALGTGALTVLSGAAYGTAYASGGLPFLSIQGTATSTLANNISLSGTAGFYAIQKASNTGVAVLSGIISGGGAGTVLQLDSPTGGDNASTFQLNGANTFSGTLRLNRGRVILNNLGALGDASALLHVATNANTTSGNVVFNVGGTFANPIFIDTANNAFNTQSNAVTLSGAISGGVGFYKMGAGNLTLSGQSTFTGALTVAQGSVILASSNRLAAGASATIGSAATTGRLVLGDGSAAFSQTLAGLNSSGLGGSVVGNAAGSALTLSVTSGSATFAGVLGGAGAGENNLSLVKSGAGTQYLNGANTFTGGVTVSAGVLSVASTASLPGFATSGRNTVAAGATLAVQNTFADADVLSLAAATTWASPAADLGFDTAAGNRTFASALTGDFRVAKSGANILTLSGANTFTGGLEVNEGFVSLASLGALPGALTPSLNTVASGAGIMVSNAVAEADATAMRAAATIASGGFFGFDTAAGNRTFASAVTGSAGLVKGGANTLTLTGASTYSGNTSVLAGTLELGGSATLGSGTYAGAITLAAGTTLAVSTSANQTLSGGFTGSGTVSKSGLGTLTLSHASNSPAAINLTGGTLALGSVLAAQHALIDVGASGAQRLAFTVAGTNTYTVGGLQGSDAVELGANSLTVGGNNLTSVFDGALVGTGALSKIGSGTFTLNGASALSGGATVSVGTLWLGGGGPTVLGNLTMNGGDGTNVRTSRTNQFLATTEVNGTTATGSWNRFELYGNNQVVAGIVTGNSTTLGGLVVQTAEADNAGGAPATLTLAGSGNYVFNGHLRNHGSGSTNTLFLNKTGSGTQSLYGNVIYHTGMTTVTGGTLLISLTNNTNASQRFVSPINNQSTVNLESAALWSTTGALGGSGTYNKSGTNTLELNGGQLISTTGQINIQAGTLQNNNNAVNWAANRADIAITAGAILDLYADAVFLDVLSGAGTVQSAFGNSAATSSTGVLGFERLVLGNNSGTGTFAGLIRNNATGAAINTGAGNGGLRLDKLGTGTQTLTTAHTYTGGTWVGGGTLELDFTGLTTPTNLLSSSGALLLNGGTLSIKGKAAAANAQTFAGLTLAAGGGQLLVNPNGATSATVTLGALTATAAGGSALVGLAPAAGAGTLAITTTSTVADGIFSGRLVYTDGTNFDFAGTASGASPFTLGALATYTDGLAGAVSTTNARITASASVAASQTVKTLKVQAPAASQLLEIATGQTLSVAAGLLFTGTNAFAVNGGTLAGGTGSGGAQDLVIHQYNTGGVTIGSTVGNNGANATALTKAGSGALTLSANATYTGTTFLNAGTLTFGGTSASTTLQVAGGTLVLNGVAAATTYNLNGGTVRVGAAGVVAAGATLNVNSGTFDLSGQNVTVANLGVGGVLGTVTDNAAGTGTSTLAVTGYTNSTYTLFADGATRKLALSLTNANSAPFLLNPSNTFSGGLLLRNDATGTRLSIDRPVFNTGSAGAIVSSPFGRGTITIGEAATDKAQIYVALSSVTILNDIIFNTGVGTDRPGAIRNDFHGLLLAGTLTANLAPVTLSGNSSGTTRITGRITGPEGLWVRQNSFVTGAIQQVVLDNQTSQANDYLGATTVDTNQAIRLAANEQLPDGAGFGSVTLNGTLNLYGNSETINGLTGAGIVEGGAAIPLFRLGSGDASGAFSGVIRNTAGTLSLEKIGSGTQFLSGANTYSGTTTVSGGVLAVASASSLPGWSTSGRVTVASGAALALGNAFTDADIATFLATPALASGASLGFDTSSGNRAYAANLTNAGRASLGLVKVGANTLTLSGTNTYSGLTSVREGILSVSSSALPSWSAGAFRVASGAGLAVGNTVSDAAFAAALATGNFAGGSLAGFDTTDGDRSYGTAISDLAVGSLGLVKTGTNSLTISGASSFTGVTQVLGGTLRLGNASALGSTAAGATVASGATLDLNGTAVGAEAITLSGSLVNDGASAASLSGGVTLAAASTFGGSGDLTLSGILSGSGALTKSGAGRTTLTAVNTASGNLAITGGILEVGGSGQLNSGTYAGTIANAGTLAISTSANQTLSGVVSGAGSLLKSGVGELTLSAANTFSGGVVVSSGTLRLSNNNAAAGTGTITLGDAATGSAAVSLLTGQSPRTFNNNIVVSAQGSGLVTIGSDNGSAGQPITYAGALTLNRAVTLRGSSPDRTTYTGKISGNVGTLTISGSRTTIDNNTNDFVGAIVISSGATLQINGDTAIPAGTAVTATGLLSLNTGAVAIGSLSGSGTVSAITAGARVLTIGSDNTSTAFSGVISNNAGTVGITKAGNGTLTLSGINTFTGNIAVNAGTLSLTGANTVSGNVTVSNGTLRIA
ncbi:MAG: beta strand repeat-containing protein, partial [Opitutia bacterium]